MLTAVKNQIRVTFLAVKYALLKEMLNKATFISNIVFMVLNNATFIIQWVILYSLKSDVGGYSMNQVLMLWAVSAGGYGFSHFFFKNSYSLSNTITEGKLDAYLVQPKNVLISSISSSVEASAIGDMIYGLIIFLVCDFNLLHLCLFILLSILSGLMLTAIAVILGSLSFWFRRSDTIADRGNSLMVNFSTYPDGIFNGVSRIILYSIIPIGFTTYIPVQILVNFNALYFFIIVLFTVFLVLLAFLIFYSGLRRYSSSNLMSARI